MKNQILLLDLGSALTLYRYPLLCLLTAFIVTLLFIPPLIRVIHRFKLLDVPNERKVHRQPIPTLGGIAIVAGMLFSLMLWFPFQFEPAQVCFFFSMIALFLVGIMDDLKDLSAKYKFLVQFALAALMAASGIRIQSFEGLFGIHELPVLSQYTLTILTIVGITNAFNLVDGIDGLAGGLAFMSLMILGLFLSINGDMNTALIAFALAGGTLAFLYFNFNPAKIFMGDTGSLVLGFVIAVLCIRLMQVNGAVVNAIPTNTPLFVLGIVMIPVFDTLRVFTERIWRGGSPFVADRTHIHHLLTNEGFSHGFAVRVIYAIHSIILLLAYLLQTLRPEFVLIIMIAVMLVATVVLKNSRQLLRFNRGVTMKREESVS